MKIAIKLAIFIASLAVAPLLGGATASAVSDYDESYQNTDSLMLSLDGRQSIDVTLNWSGFITGTYTEKNLRYRNGNNTATEAEINAWRDSYNNKQYWSVSQSCTGNTCVVYVVWSTSNQMSLTWRTGPSWWPGVIVNDHTNIYTAELNYNTGNSNDVDVFINKTATRRTLTMPTHPDTVVKNLFAFVSDYNYPTGYEGEEIPAELPEEEDTVGTAYKPLWKWSVQNKKITLVDITPNTILEEHGVNLCLFQLPDTLYGDTFTEYQYDCLGKPVVSHTFPELGTYNVLHRQYSSTENKWYEHAQTFIIDGSTYNGSSADFKNCTQENFPYLDFDNCLKNMNYIINLLSFKTLKLSNEYISYEGCRTLIIIDDWIYKPEQVVCPQFPDYIRSIITPFIAVFLGLLTLKFITRRNGAL